MKYVVFSLADRLSLYETSSYSPFSASEIGDVGLSHVRANEEVDLTAISKNILSPWVYKIVNEKKFKFACIKAGINPLIIE